jgi:hypothetical protein
MLVLVMDGFMKYASEMGSETMMYMPCFIKFGSGVQKLLGGGGGIRTQQGDRVSPLLFFQIK